MVIIYKEEIYRKLLGFVYARIGHIILIHDCYPNRMIFSTRVQREPEDVGAGT